jgi:long-chain acyl-CoA synthetase
LLNGGLGKYSNSARALHEILFSVVEFLIADLAFTAKSITTMTISSSELLAEVLDNHPPSAIITDSDFLPHIIEQIYDLNQHSHTTVIIVGDPGIELAGEIDLLLFNDIEKEGAGNPVDLSPPTGRSYIK